MKIALLTEIINTKSGSRAPIEIAKALVHRGHYVTIFAYPYLVEKTIKLNLEKSKIGVELIKTKKFIAPLILNRKLRQSYFDVISFHGTLPFFIGAKLSGIPIVRTYYGTQLDALSDKSFPNQPNILIRWVNKLSNWVILAIEKIMIKNSARVIAISKYCQMELVRLYKIPSEVIYLGSHTPPRVAAKKNNKYTTILSVSRIVPYKGFHRLISIFNELDNKYPNIKLVIVGSSPNKKYLNYLKKISNKNVKFLVDISNYRLLAAYYHSDVYATFDRFMFFGMPILEAASFGIPTVAINKCAANELVKHKSTGYLANSDREFRNYLEELINDKKLRTKLGKNALKYSKNFSWVSTAAIYEKIFRETSLHIGNK